MKTSAFVLAAITAFGISGLAHAAGPTVMSDAALDQVVAGQTLFIFINNDPESDGYALSKWGPETNGHPGRSGNVRGGGNWAATGNTCDTNTLICTGGWTAVEFEGDIVLTAP